jgi:hypothetical protein
MSMMNGKMYKVMMPVEVDGKTTHWLRLGRGFDNRDNSINCYLESLPIAVFAGKELKLQIRELGEDELRQRDERRSNGNGHATTGPGALGTLPF